MPPKRGRGASRAASIARGASSSPAPPSSSVLSEQRTPRPARFSSSYGSPSAFPSTIRVTTSSATGLGDAIKKMRNSTEEDRQARIARRAAETSSLGVPNPSRTQARTQIATQDEEQEGAEEASRAMPPPPPSNRSSLRTTTNSQQNARGGRALTVQPDPPRSGKVAPRTGRYTSEPPTSDAPSQKSFIEESELYGGADFATPRVQQPQIPSTQPPGIGPVGNSPLSPISTTKRGESVTQAAPFASDSIDDDNDEDPLHHPTPRGISSGRPVSSRAGTPQSQPQQVQNPQPLGMADRFLQAGLGQRNSPNIGLNDGSTNATEHSRGSRPVQPNPFQQTREATASILSSGIKERPARLTRSQDAIMGDLKSPRPDRAISQPPADNIAIPAAKAGSNDQSSRQRLDQPALSPVEEECISAAGFGSTKNMVPLRPQNRPNRSVDDTSQPPVPSGSSNSPVQSQTQTGQTSSTFIRPQGPRQNGPVGPKQPAAPPSGDVGQADSQAGKQRGSHRVNQPGRDRVPKENDGADFPQGEDENIFDRVLNWVYSLFRISQWPSRLRKAALLGALLMLICWFFLVLLELYVPVHRWEGIKVGKKYQYHGNSLVGWRQNILQFVPWIVLHPFAVLTGNLDYADYRNTLHWLTINQGNNEITIDSLSGAVQQLRRILPELIKVDAGIGTSDWDVQDDFWHALDQEMKRGGLMWSLLSIHRDADGSHTISDTHWGAIKQRIDNEQLFISDRPADGEDRLALSNEVMSYVDQSVSASFKAWLTKNAEAVRRAQGGENGVPSASHTDLYSQAEKAIAARLKDLGLEERVVSKEEFISKIEHDFRQREAEFKSEMKALHEKLSQALGIAMEAKNSADLPSGLSRTEVEGLVKESVRRAVGDAQLEALAKGSIKSHLNSELLAQKNYFSALRGAVVDPHLTSASFDRRPKREARQQGGSKTGSWAFWKGWLKETEHPDLFRNEAKDSSLPFAPSFALERWEEDGECWCAGHREDTHTVDLSIHTADDVIPQYLVVEHIERTATFDPDAMPKEIEFWIKAPTDKSARILSHLTKKWDIPQSGSDRNLTQQGFVKVGLFEFDGGADKGQSQVFKLPNELVEIGVQTRHVHVRVNSNYGAADHTCFYRLRLFGRGQSDDK